MRINGYEKAGQGMDEGAGDLDAHAFQTALSEKAIRFSARADRDYTVVTVTTLKENVGEAFRLLGLALKSPRFDAEAVGRVRSQMLQHLDQDKQEPGTVADKAFDRAFFGDHAYAHDPGGDAPPFIALTSSEGYTPIFMRTAMYNRSMFAVSALAVSLAASGAAQAPTFKSEKFDIKGEGGTDYVAVESATGRVFVSRSTHVMVVDGDSSRRG